MSDTSVTVKDLKQLLEGYPDHLIVCTAGDDEGNSFRELYADCVVPGQYDERDYEFTTYGEENDDGEQEELKLEECNAICIW